MRLFDEEMREVFLYDYTSGNFVDSWTTVLFGYRDIPEEEIEALRQEHDRLHEEYQRGVEAAHEQSGIRRFRKLSNTKNRMSEEEGRVIMENLRLALEKCKYPADFYDFMKERLGLKEIEGESRSI
jgi:hypothetical protein